MRVLATVLPVLLTSVAVAAQTGGGFLGRTIDEISKSDFFTSYKLTGVRRRAVGEYVQLLFQPTGPSHDFVRLSVRTTAEGKVTQVDAALTRVFVDGDAAQTARGFVRALLRDGVPPGDAPEVDALVKELASSTAPKTPSAAYEVFSGRRPALTATGKRVRVYLSNVSAGPSPLFRVSILHVGDAR